MYYNAVYVISAAINAVLKENSAGLYPFPGADFNQLFNMILSCFIHQIPFTTPRELALEVLHPSARTPPSPPPQ